MSEMNFNNYDLNNMPADGVYGLAGGLLPEMAEGLGYDLGQQPSEEALRGFIEHIGPAKQLQDNIGLVQQRLDTNADAVTLAANWTERSGVLAPVNRSFANPELATPGHVELAVITGGVARWMLRRAERLQQHVAEGNEVGRVLLVGGERAMKPTEHRQVADWAGSQAPTEGKFMRQVIAPYLRHNNLEVDVIEPATGKGSDLMVAAAWAGGVINKQVLVVANAPAAVQNAGQLRAAAVRIPKGENYDQSGDQLFVLADGVDVARHGEPAATHQNPLTALGQIARNALALHAEQQRA
jgi:hypothetical protein